MASASVRILRHRPVTDNNQGRDSVCRTSRRGIMTITIIDNAAAVQQGFSCRTAMLCLIDKQRRLGQCCPLRRVDLRSNRGNQGGDFKEAAGR